MKRNVTIPETNPKRTPQVIPSALFHNNLERLTVWPSSLDDWFEFDLPSQNIGRDLAYQVSIHKKSSPQPASEGPNGTPEHLRPGPFQPIGRPQFGPVGGEARSRVKGEQHKDIEAKDGDDLKKPETEPRETALSDEERQQLEQLRSTSKVLAKAIESYEQHGKEQVTLANTPSEMLTLILGGRQDQESVAVGVKWFMSREYPRQWQTGYYYLSTYYSSQAKAQVGGDAWNQIFPQITKGLLIEQAKHGSWPADVTRERKFGSAYTTSLANLALTPPYPILPIDPR